MLPRPRILTRLQRRQPLGLRDVVGVELYVFAQPAYNPSWSYELRLVAPYPQSGNGPRDLSPSHQILTHSRIARLSLLLCPRILARLQRLPPATWPARRKSVLGATHFQSASHLGLTPKDYLDTF
ncbi:hypothetical protein KFU94_60400 [Chloroflexi bacterium TSY]|nr:hypothetical protein [Chloroflexi bacterium TSY]